MNRDASLTPARVRIECLDTLRGVAVLGIFAVNILAFAFPWYALSNPALFPAFNAPGGAFWWSFSTAGFQLKFITIFSALFGAGIALILTDDPSPSRRAWHGRRMLWLFVIGMIHNYLIWYGDILVIYSVLGFIITGAARWRAVRLYWVGGALIASNFVLFVGFELLYAAMEPAELADLVEEVWAPAIDKRQETIALYTAPFWERLPHTMGDAAFAQIGQGGMLALRIAGVMMLGMALVKNGFLTLGWRVSRYGLVGVVATGAGFAGSLWGARQMMAADFDMLRVFPGQAALYWASLLQAFGYASLVMAISAGAAPLLRAARAPFAAVGRMALSNYLLSSLIGVGVFYGPPGFGAYAGFSYGALALMVAAVWAAILLWSPLWFSVFRFGPAEWGWRALSYGERPPLRR